MNLEELRIDCAIKQKKGIHFISASIIIWILVTVIQILDLPILTKNLFTFCCTAPLLPLAFLMSKFFKIQFQDKTNPLNNLGILFSINQMLYLLIANVGLSNSTRENAHAYCHDFWGAFVALWLAI